VTLIKPRWSMAFQTGTEELDHTRFGAAERSWLAQRFSAAITALFSTRL
jgi:hypothetical protein